MKDLPESIATKRRAPPAALSGIVWAAFILAVYLSQNAHYYIVRIGAAIGWH